MAVAATVTKEIDLGQAILQIGTLAFSGNYVAGGEVPTTSGRSGIRSKMTTKAPLSVKIDGKAGFEYEYDRANEKVLVRGQEPTSATAGVIALSQIAVAAYPAGVTGDVVDYTAIFPKFG